MRRADRLFQIIQLLRRRRRAVTAASLAEQLEVSERTIYRDVRDLVASGTPIEGAAGVGYSLRRSYDLPPLMFDAEEIEALVLGARVVAAFGDERLARSAASALSKVETVLPQGLRPRLSQSALFAPRTGAGRAISETLLAVRGALGSHRKLCVRYRRADGQESRRVLRPLGAFFWGSSWTLAAWCELREGFRNFRLDRMIEVEALTDTFEEEAGKTLRDYLRSLGEDGERLLDG